MINHCPAHVRRIHADAIHERWGHITPFRLGWLIGETGIGLDDANPYDKPNSQRAYLEGIAHGQSVRAMQAASVEGGR